MTQTVGIVVWLVWLVLVALSFALLEFWGVRRAHDRWPSLSEVWKGWEDDRIVFIDERRVQIRERKGGLIRWTWRRWLTLAALVCVGTYLLLHWIAEVV